MAKKGVGFLRREMGGLERDGWLNSEMGGKSVAHMLASAALWFRIQTSLKKTTRTT